MTVLIQARIGGRPRTKGSLKVYCVKDRKHTIHLEEEVDQSKTWRAAVAREIRQAQMRAYGELLGYRGPVEVRLVFHFPRTESVAGGPVPSHDTQWPVHITLGDADKLARNVLDALSAPTKRSQIPLTSGLIVDDSQVVLLSVAKFWSTADRDPGVDILVMGVDVPERTAEQEFEIWMQRTAVGYPDPEELEPEPWL